MTAYLLLVALVACLYLAGMALLRHEWRQQPHNSGPPLFPRSSRGRTLHPGGDER